jgi:hypothetical protein
LPYAYSVAEAVIVVHTTGKISGLVHASYVWMPGDAPKVQVAVTMPSPFVCAKPGSNLPLTASVGQKEMKTSLMECLDMLSARMLIFTGSDVFIRALWFMPPTTSRLATGGRGPVPSEQAAPMRAPTVMQNLATERRPEPNDTMFISARV